MKKENLLTSLLARILQCKPHNFLTFTINGRLYWTGVYFPEITTKSKAEEFVDLSIRILMGACA